MAITNTLSAMKLEELAMAALAKANYDAHIENKLAELHHLDGENLDLGCISNSQRGFAMSNKRVQIKKKGGSRLSRELKKISIQ